jgi:hypothetical protein
MGRSMNKNWHLEGELAVHSLHSGLSYKKKYNPLAVLASGAKLLDRLRRKSMESITNIYPRPYYNLSNGLDSDIKDI